MYYKVNFYNTLQSLERYLESIYYFATEKGTSTILLLVTNNTTECLRSIFTI